jgi:type IV fimbrial biogenesis protein FimT
VLEVIVQSGTGCRRACASRGFTLIEMLVVMTLIAIMLGIGVPSFRSFVAGQQVKTATFELMTALMLARSEAVKRNKSVTITPESSSAWGSGWKVMDGATVLYEQQTLAGVTITPKDTSAPANPTTVASVDFGTSGRPAAKAYFEVVGISATKCVKLDPTGLPSSSQGACS